MISLIEWLLPKVHSGLDKKQIYLEFLADPEVAHLNSAEETITKRIREVEDIVNKYDALITEDFDRATRLLSRNESKDNLELAIRSYDIHDIPGLREWADVPEDTWECYSQEIRASQNKTAPWFIVHGKFRPKKPEQITVEELLLKHKSLIESYVPRKIEVPVLPKGKYLLDISLPDLHLGNRSYDNKDSLEQCSGRFNNAISFFLQEASNKELDEIIITFGSDYFTINADKPETAKGTVQETSDFYDKIYEVGLQTAVDSITYLRNHARKVRVIGVLGNHDPQSSVWLMLALNQIFKNVDGVEVDYKYEMRKYYRFGVTALTFVHKLQKNLKSLPLLMFQEMIDRNLIDSNVKYYEIQGGHLHQPGKYDMPAETTNQKITQRILSSLSSSARYSMDEYGEHTSEGQAFLYNFDKGFQNMYVWRS